MRFNPSSQSATRRAFTLIELLVVIAIIAILTAILFPVFASAREKARESACTSNLKQIGLAFMQYDQDYDEVTPHCIYDGNRENAAYHAFPYEYGVSIGSDLYPYTKAAQVWRCPSDSISQPTAVYTPQNENNGQYGGFSNPSYIWNYWFMDLSLPINGPSTNNGNDDIIPLQMSQLQTPASDGILFESWGTSWFFNNLPGIESDLAGIPSAASPVLQQGHFNGQNVLYADCHVKWITGNYLYSQVLIEAANPDPNTPQRPFGVKPSIFHE